jgi:hypothetical protein
VNRYGLNIVALKAVKRHSQGSRNRCQHRVPLSHRAAADEEPTDDEENITREHAEIYPVTARAALSKGADTAIDDIAILKDHRTSGQRIQAKPHRSFH